MKIEATVHGIKDNLETLAVSLLGWPTSAPDGTLATSYSLDIPASARARKAFHLGRKIRITIEPV